ncbi:MAG: amidohydrolase family protein, partial [Sphingomonas sp.]
MRRMMIAAVAALLAGTAAQAETFAIQAGHVITDAAKPARGASTVIVTDGKIVRIEDGATAPAGATGLTPKYSEPYAATIGLRNALTTARAGFTTVRDLGGPPLASIAMRDAIKEGGFPGPRIQVAGPALSIIGGHGDSTVGLAPNLRAAIEATGEQFWVCTGPLECGKAVRKIASYGVDVIKFHATGGVLDDGKIGLEQHFTDEEMKAICDTAHQLGLKVAAHAHGAKGIGAAVRAGVDSIEHGTYADDADVALMKARGTYYVGTLMAFSGLQLYLGKGIYTANTEAKARQTLLVWGKALNRAYKAGVPIALGTDAAVFPH